MPARADGGHGLVHGYAWQSHTVWEGDNVGSSEESPDLGLLEPVSDEEPRTEEEEEDWNIWLTSRTLTLWSLI